MIGVRLRGMVRVRVRVSLRVAVEGLGLLLV